MEIKIIGLLLASLSLSQKHLMISYDFIMWLTTTPRPVGLTTKWWGQFEALIDGQKGDLRPPGSCIKMSPDVTWKGWKTFIWQKEWNHVYTIPYQRNTATTSRQEKTIQVPSKSIQRPKAKAFWTVFRIHKIRTRGIIQFGLLHGNEAIGVPQCVITCFLFRRCASKIGGAAYKAS